MMKIKPLSRCLAVAFGGSFVLASGAFAQDAQKQERIEITGSSIKRIDSETALPVTIIRREDIEKLGVQSAAELVEKIAANNGQGYNIASALGDAARPGFAGASLRGLGSNNTLVLLNGRRLAVYAFDGGGVNLGSIPSAAIDRVEILRDGASAIYGTDAVGGVINFITRKDFAGLQLEGSFFSPQASAGDSKNIQATFGYGDLGKDRFNIMGVVSHNDLTSIKASERSYARTAFIRPADIQGGVFNRLSSNAFPAAVVVPTGLASPGGPLYNNGAGCLPPASYGISPTDGRCRFDYANVIDIVPSRVTTSFLGRATFQLSADHQLFAEYSLAKQKYIFRISPTPASEATTLNGDPVLLPATSRFYPTAWLTRNFPTLLGQPLNLYYRSLEAGPRTNQANADESRLAVGAEGIIAGWDYNAGFIQAKSKVTETYLSGYLSERATIAAFATGNINPFGLNDATGVALLRSAQVTGKTRISDSARTAFDIKASREIAQLPAGPMAMAVGLEIRREEFNDKPLAVLNTGDIIGGGGTQFPVVASRNVSALFTEVNIPILKTLEGQIALRHDRYNDFGSTTNPKLSARWQPSKTFLARGSYNTGFRAPTLPDLYGAQSQTNSGGNYDDPLYDAAVGCANVFSGQYCNAQLKVIQGGNPRLKPETSKQFTLGVLIEPTAAFSVGLDYFNIKQQDLIGFINPDVALGDYIANFNPATRTSSSVYSNLITTRRDTATGATVIDAVNSFFLNLGRQNTSGVDISAKFRLPKTSVGDFRIGFDGTYIISQKSSLASNAPLVEGVGQFLSNGAVVRFKHNTQLSWEQGAWSAALTYNWQSGYYDQNLGANGLLRRVGSYETFDVVGAWTGIKNLRVTAGIRNLLDRNPPYSNQNAYFPVGYDPTYADVRGRTFYVRGNYKFW